MLYLFDIPEIDLDSLSILCLKAVGDLTLSFIELC